MNLEDLGTQLHGSGFLQSASLGAIGWWLRDIVRDVLLMHRERQALRHAVPLARAGGDPAQVLQAVSRNSRSRRPPPPPA